MKVHGKREGFEFPRGFFAASIDEVIEGKLYLGNYEASKQRELLKKYNITAVLVAGSGLRASFPDDFKYRVFKLSDDLETDLFSVFGEAFEYIESNETVFVHCQAGISRSASLVIAYLMKKCTWTYPEAYSFLKSKRKVIHPNKNFQS